MENDTTPSESLTTRRRNLFRRAEFLPGFDAYVAEHPEVGKYITEQWRFVENAVRDDDIVRFEDAAGSWLKACHRVNELLAETYRQAHPEPESWELRYFKWMKIVFIRFESPRGEFFLVPRRPRRRPKARHWYTADEMMALVLPGPSALIALSDKLPLRPEDMSKPGMDEKHLHLDFTGDKLRQFYVSGGISAWKKETSSTD